MSFVAAAIAGSAVVGAVASNNASRAQTSSANRQIDATNAATERQIELNQPWLNTGQDANAMLAFANGTGPMPTGMRGFEATPGFEFAMDRAQRGIDNSAASRGQTFSGATIRAQQENALGMANQEYGNWLNRLMQQSGMGQASANASAANIGNANMQNGNALASIGNAQAAGAIGMGNAVMGGINNLVGLNAYQQANNAPQYGAPTTSPRPMMRPWA